MKYLDLEMNIYDFSKTLAICPNSWLISRPENAVLNFLTGWTLFYSLLDSLYQFKKNCITAQQDNKYVMSF